MVPEEKMNLLQLLLVCNEVVDLLQKLGACPWILVEKVTPPPGGTKGSQRSGLVVQGNAATLTLRNGIHGWPSPFLSRNIKAGVKLFSSSISMSGSRSWLPTRWLLLD